MSDDSIRTQTIADLKNLVAALDRRLPKLADLGEPAIARESAELREKAIQLIRRLEASGAASKDVH